MEHRAQEGEDVEALGEKNIKRDGTKSIENGEAYNGDEWER